MFQKGDRIRIRKDQAVLKRQLGFGTFGEAWKATRCSNQEPIVIKRLRSCNDDQLLRMKAIGALRLSERLVGTASISEVLLPRGKRDWIGCVMPYAVGISLEEWLNHRPEFNILDNLLVAQQIAKTVADAHSLGIAHGDLHPRNSIICNYKGVPLTTLIDWDNAAIAGMPPPASPGRKHFLAPEAMEAVLRNEHYPPDIKTERCSVAKVLHWVFTGRHCFQTSDEREFEEAAIQGRWNSDPADGPADIDVLGGVSNQYLNPELSDLFRRAFGRERDNRPAMDEWLSALRSLLDEGVPQCEACGGPMLPAVRTHCPYCNSPFHGLVAITSHGHRFAANGTPILIGRDTLSSSRVSLRHAVITQMGPETFITDLGSKNGTFRRGSNKWIRLPGHKQCLIRPGDKIRLGDVELQIIGA